MWGPGNVGLDRINVEGRCGTVTRGSCVMKKEGSFEICEWVLCIALMAHSRAVEPHVGSIGPTMKLKLG